MKKTDDADRARYDEELAEHLAALLVAEHRRRELAAREAESSRSEDGKQRHDAA